MTVLKWAFFVFLALTNTLQFISYRKLSRAWEKMPVVAATITKSDLANHHDVSGRRTYAADIRFAYSFRGNEYESATAVLPSPQIFHQWGYVTSLLGKYKVGEGYNARVVPNAPDLAYLEVEPLNKLAAIALPLLTIVYGLYLLGLGWVMFAFLDN